MAVYTDVSPAELGTFLSGYDIGTLTSFHGIAEGVENSNFLVQTTTGSYILTLYEKRVKTGDLPFFIGLMQHLAARGLSCPQPVAARSGAMLAAPVRGGGKPGRRRGAGPCRHHRRGARPP